MITTITTSTVTTVTALAALGFTGIITLVAMVSLIALLTTKEVAGATHSAPQLRVARFVNVGIVPLVAAFVVILVVKIVEIL